MANWKSAGRGGIYIEPYTLCFKHCPFEIVTLISFGNFESQSAKTMISCFRFANLCKLFRVKNSFLLAPWLNELKNNIAHRYLRGNILFKYNETFPESKYLERPSYIKHFLYQLLRQLKKYELLKKYSNLLDCVNLTICYNSKTSRNFSFRLKQLRRLQIFEMFASRYCKRFLKSLYLFLQMLRHCKLLLSLLWYKKKLFFLYCLFSLTHQKNTRMILHAQNRL